MRWTVTVKDHTYGTGAEIHAYECRVTRVGDTVRLSVQNSGSGAVKEGRFLMPARVASILGRALQLAAGGDASLDVVVPIDEAATKKP